MKNQFIGVLSGTSMDAVDVALVSFEAHRPKLLATKNYPIPEDFRKTCLELSQSDQSSIDEIGSLNILAGELFANAILALLAEQKISAEHIRAIGSHGQTLRHRPDLKYPFSLQMGDPNTIVEKTGILTIADFRTRDIAAGGQGAPLAPAFHLNVFKNPDENRVIVNIGGITNITVLSAENPTTEPELPLIGMDTGPGNCLLDSWIYQTRGLRFDRNGNFAQEGQIHSELLEICLADPYFSKQPPKSTGREYFNLAWLEKKIEVLGIANLDQFKAADIQATLLALTAHSLSSAILKYAPKDAEIFVCGGGAHNLFLLNSLSKMLDRPIHTTEALGISPDWVEAVLFAWLAKQTLEGKPGNCPSVTGARTAAILGGIFGYRPDLSPTLL